MTAPFVTVDAGGDGTYRARCLSCGWRGLWRGTARIHGGCDYPESVALADSRDHRCDR